MKKVLIIDDEPDTITFLGTWLEDLGYATCAASDGLGGMEALLSERPDLVLMDLKMPNLSGVQLYRQILGHEELAALPVIFITGVAEVSLFDGSCERLPEPAACLAKPVDLQKLLDAITAALAGTV